jgi:PAS domain S-box-containing protein
MAVPLSESEQIAAKGPRQQAGGPSADAAAAAPEPTELPAAASPDPVNILIVDDEPANLTVLETVLDDPSYRLVSARSADEALLALMAQEFALLILDVRMPSMTGFELAQLIKQRKKTEQIPIIFLTAYYNEDQHVLDGYSSGAVDYLHKPVNAPVLRSKVAIFANLHRQARALERMNIRLVAEAAVRREAQERMQELNRTLEERVKARTRDLAERAQVLEAAQDKLRSLADQIQGLADAAPGFIWSTDPQGEFTFMSKRFEVFTGISFAQMSGAGWRQALHPEDLERNTQQLQAAIRGQTAVSARMRLRRADGSFRWIESSAVPVFDKQAAPEARFRGLVGVSMDISELVYAEQALRETDRRKDQFLATLAHELRNPLAPIRNAVQILRNQTATDTPARKLQDIIERQVSQMARMVDDLLDVSRISRGRLELRRTQVSLQQVVQAAVETSRPHIERQRHRLELMLPAEPLMLDADLTRLSQVFANLLNNAAKYTDAMGLIRLKAQVRDGEVVVEVSDNGAGIPQHQMENLFELFSRGDGEDRQAGGGLGIGLALVKQLVELHRGRVTAKSDGPGKGSAFTVSLPLTTRARVQSEVEAPAPAPRAATPSLRVLVVDDSEDAVLTLSMMIQGSGYTTEVAHDGEEALAVAENYRPDVMLLDIGMPKMDGYEVCRRLRQSDWGRKIIVIALTGWGQAQDRRATAAAGFNLHLVKPADPVKLLGMLGQLESQRSAVS